MWWKNLLFGAFTWAVGNTMFSSSRVNSSSQLPPKTEARLSPGKVSEGNIYPWSRMGHWTKRNITKKKNLLVPIAIFGRKLKTFNFGNSSLSPGDLMALGRIKFVNIKSYWMPVCVATLCPKCLGPGDTKQLSVCFTSKSRSMNILKAFLKFT